MRPSDFIEPVAANRDQPLYEGVVDNNANARTDEVFVRLLDFDDGLHKIGPVEWEPIVTEKGVFFPKEDAYCLVAKPPSQTKRVWMLSWKEQGSPDVTAFSE